MGSGEGGVIGVTVFHELEKGLEHYAQFVASLVFLEVVFLEPLQIPPQRGIVSFEEAVGSILRAFVLEKFFLHQPYVFLNLALFKY